jgi:hypothetical protein
MLQRSPVAWKNSKPRADDATIVARSSQAGLDAMGAATFESRKVPVTDLRFASHRTLIGKQPYADERRAAVDQSSRVAFFCTRSATSSRSSERRVIGVGRV